MIKNGLAYMLVYTNINLKSTSCNEFFYSAPNIQIFKYYQTLSIAIMTNTIQINLRLSKLLVNDMEYIAENLGVNRNDWLKVKIAEMITTEIRNQKTWIQEKVERDFIFGKVSNQEFKEKMGFKPTSELIKERKRQNDMVINGRLSTRKYLLRQAGVE